MYMDKLYSMELCCTVTLQDRFLQLAPLFLFSLCSPHPPCLQGRGPKKAGKRSTNKKGSKKAGSTRSKSSKKASLLIGGDDLSQKLYQTMEKHKEVCVCVCVCMCGGGDKVVLEMFSFML